MRKAISMAVLTGALALPAFAEGDTHYVAVHVNQNDPHTINMALNNVQNVSNYYESKGDDVIVELVAYGPGVHMFRTDTSPVAERISTMALEIEGLHFTACANTIRAMTAKAGKDIVLMSEAEIVPSGVVRLIELQEQGYAYVRP